MLGAGKAPVSPLDGQPEGRLHGRWFLSLLAAEPAAQEQHPFVFHDRVVADMEMRPHLRRVYLALNDLAEYAPVAQRLGFGFQVLDGGDAHAEERLTNFSLASSL